MSVVGILLHLSRAIIHAHNNAKVRNLMDAMPSDVGKDARRQASSDTTEDKSGAIRRGGR
ncbi:MULTISPECIES: hypothetical protein [unclassified Mesorhizobium]|uniref:hypothetical protein n=1 Tax=unclassified Mesorhizobium TaxID=325217 RepID=UPI000FCBFFA2|nr:MULTISPECIES: hypothetical protein [unclassified Mesorhizobium]TGP22130.1 hypothetical protein EN874_021915 [Mesorhizobium sp. M1D.F.Ca.ET.231.01.1.1]TGP30515.1 hypothetical protein EN877_20295 [Mesorhizobium sp. M1D.F.Ca.ET.234.01.1.1]TGS44591.1 hypothetical protein EN827_20290 [Mesorhizobium sp. M1D.F.Ca.ET.184.01.1.1]TGS60631.1 hypothetical protein EN826_020290 [Mesorhizobium sp. M1D.F.Ca.ET.183.01.1.1]